MGLLAEGGASALSMRAVAARLGVVPNALYNHVRNKAELVDAMLDEALGDVHVLAEGAPRHVLVAIMVETYDALARRRELIPLYLERQGARGVNAVALGEEMDEALRRLGADGAMATRVRHVLIVQVIGFAAYGNAAPDKARNRSAFIDSLTWALDGALPQR
jgi:TetR/AcrR family tetracycline transcriptional repressor